MDNRVLQTQTWLISTYGNNPSFPNLTPDGITGQATFRALIWALQYETNAPSLDGVFGSATITAMKTKYPTLSESSNPNAEPPRNIIYILQGALWCKGISPGGFTGIFGSATASAIRNFQANAGLEVDGIVRPYLMQGIMNTDSYTFIATDDIFDTYRSQVQKGINKYYGEQIGLIAPNGIWERKSQTNLIKAAQIEWNTTIDGKWGNDTLNKAPTISKNTSGYTNTKRILQWALTVNGFYPGAADGVWGNATYNALFAFQEFLCLGADGICGKQTWASLMTSKGDQNRKANALDTSKQITLENAMLLYQNGYRDIGRYLTNTPGSSFDKELYLYELDILKEAGLNVFPIYQTSGGKASYFNSYQGIIDSYRAVKAAKFFGFPPEATIYFAIDYDVLMKDINSNIMPYFKSIQKIAASYFNIGVYGPRLICTKLYEAGLTTASFVSNMSSGFTCNIGQKMPENWSYDQFHEVSDTNSEYVGNMGYDKIIASSRKTATAPTEFITYESIDYPYTKADFSVIRLIYEYAQKFLSHNTPSVMDINLLVLQYLSRNYSGFSWELLKGKYDSKFDTYLNTYHTDKTISLDPNDIFIYDDFTKTNVEIAHFAATLTAYIHQFPVVDKHVDALTGWAGDLAQVGGILGQTMEYGLPNYFNLEDLKKFIGYMDSELTNYTFKYVGGDSQLHEDSDSGFGIEDLLQDVDAFNIYKGFSITTTPIYDILENYYIALKSYKNRFQLFERNLTNEFEKKSIEEIALIFTKPDSSIIESMNNIFSAKFGSYDYDAYGGVLAEAFSEKIKYYIQMEKNVIS